MKIDKVFYINLEDRNDRKLEIETELYNYGIIDPERFNAIKHETIGLVGCARSHVEVLKLAKEREYKRVLIFEDDFQFIISNEEFYNCMQKIEDLEFDVCLLSYNLFQSEELPEMPFLKKVIEAETASGYIINQHYYDKLINQFSSGIPLLEQTNYHWLYANDVVWKELQKTDTWYCFNPKIGIQRANTFSDCSKTVNAGNW
jgi:glycosyl transferase family 25